ncbi:MAG: DUF2283 domain-containing protein [Candidatus Dadabacteria bacterium]|nr:MAG: hypothetical protein CUN54_10300 [Phototrophicales bacterium]RMF16623.1 MAG: DUF2283 domain-containing protein [Candidatus Dadabacteria bacterium]
MKVVYDKETDSMTITFKDVEIRDSDEIRPNVIVDYSFDDEIVRIEILHASEMVDNAREIQFAFTESVAA